MMIEILIAALLIGFVIALVRGFIIAIRGIKRQDRKIMDDYEKSEARKLRREKFIEDIRKKNKDE